MWIVTTNTLYNSFLCAFVGNVVAYILLKPYFLPYHKVMPQIPYYSIVVSSPLLPKPNKVSIYIYKSTNHLQLGIEQDLI